MILLCVNGTAPDLTLHTSFNIVLGMGGSNSAIAGGVILNWGREEYQVRERQFPSRFLLATQITLL